jgi:hypothetical protein
LRSYFEERVAAPFYKAENTAVGIRHADHRGTPYPLKLALTSPSSGGYSVGIVRSWTKATEFFLSSPFPTVGRIGSRCVMLTWKFRGAEAVEAIPTLASLYR